ncbi:hypothetical protein SCHPADRAFT_892310 [Schizopora paradoxa]|uniref:Uncharacterized protein n=1 Tax=Schizopora paradoxa TaxID=27342 RepID=A0A0H2RLZ6_9AGAM|nr:hypothetical protein SCHPADRAFT_892310 [Schizopora paradoxa]
MNINEHILREGRTAWDLQVDASMSGSTGQLGDRRSLEYALDFATMLVVVAIFESETQIHERCACKKVLSKSLICIARALARRQESGWKVGQASKTVERTVEASSIDYKIAVGASRNTASKIRRAETTPEICTGSTPDNGSRRLGNRDAGRDEEIIVLGWKEGEVTRENSSALKHPPAKGPSQVEDALTLGAKATLELCKMLGKSIYLLSSVLPHFCSGGGWLLFLVYKVEGVTFAGDLQEENFRIVVMRFVNRSDYGWISPLFSNAWGKRMLNHPPQECLSCFLRGWDTSMSPQLEKGLNVEYLQETAGYTMFKYEDGSVREGSCPDELERTSAYCKSDQSNTSSKLSSPCFVSPCHNDLRVLLLVIERSFRFEGAETDAIEAILERPGVETDGMPDRSLVSSNDSDDDAFRKLTSSKFLKV